MDKFTPDILILGYSGNKTEVRMFSLTGLSPSLVGRSRAVLLTFGFVTSFKSLTSSSMEDSDVKNSSVSSLLPHPSNNCLLEKWFRLSPLFHRFLKTLKAQ